MFLLLNNKGLNRGFSKGENTNFLFYGRPIRGYHSLYISLACHFLLDSFQPPAGQSPGRDDRWRSSGENLVGQIRDKISTQSAVPLFIFSYNGAHPFSYMQARTQILLINELDGSIKMKKKS